MKAESTAPADPERGDPSDAAWNPKRFLHQLKQDPAYMKQIAHVESLPPRQARYGKLHRPLHPRLARWLQAEGIRLWLHQTGAINRLRYPKKRLNVVITTNTASGKSLAYNLPVLDQLLRDPNATALYVFPRKALEYDQLVELQAILDAVGLPPHTAGKYDGDATREQKRRIRAHARVILTNPHGLHYYLAYPQLWRRVFSRLRFVVIDEAHVYRGVFGSNMAFVMRRLRRLAEGFGAKPQFILTSATIANPRELAESLTGLPFRVVDQDGSEAGERIFAIWVPPVDEISGEHLSAHQESKHVFLAHMRQGLRTLMFTTSRKMAELQARWAKGQVETFDPTLVERISSYRAGLSPTDRRDIEEGLKAGQIVGVTSTNALELGIDIGQLDATILSGFPGSISSFWQQAGRAGRKGTPSLTTFVPFPDALDMYYAQHPAVLFGEPHEHAILSLENPYILENHVACAAKERPVIIDLDREYLGNELERVCEALVEAGTMTYSDGKYFWAGPPTFPAGETSIEAISRESFRVYERVGAREEFLMEEEKSRVLSEMHEGAVYLYRTDTYVVEELDLAARKVVLAAEEVDYYTVVLRETDVSVVETEMERHDGQIHARFGTVNVRHHYTHYIKKSIFTDELVDKHELDYDPDEFTTKALWFTLPEPLWRAINEARYNIGGVVHAIEHGTIALIPLHVLCDRRDVGGVSFDYNLDTGLPTIYVYDGFPGGIGLAERAYAILRDLLEATRAMIEACPCTKANGCPACIMSPKCGNQNEPLDKAGAVFALARLLAPPS